MPGITYIKESESVSIPHPHNCPGCNGSPVHIAKGPGVKGSETVYVHGLPAFCETDPGAQGGCCGAPSFMIEKGKGSQTVLINNKGAGYEGAVTTCCDGKPGVMTKGSKTVIVSNA